MGNAIFSKDTGHHQRRSVRLQGYDYSRSGAYFLTICIHDRTQRLFGEIAGAHGRASSEKTPEMILNEFGNIVRDEWVRSFSVRPELKIGEYVIMPNHIHGIIIIRDVPVGAIRRVAHDVSMTIERDRATRRVAPTDQTGPKSGSIGAIIGQFKSITAKRINRLRNTPGVPVWQRNYYDHIIRDEKSLFQIRTYIKNNPLNWNSDEENPFAARPTRYVALPDPPKEFMPVR